MLINTSREILHTLILLSFFVFAPTAASAATYYVGPAGNNANPGTLSQPWRTIAKAAATLVAGDTAILLNGTYTESEIRFHTNGTTSNPITIRAQNKWLAILSSTSSCQPAISVTASYITIEDIRFTVSPSNVNCTFYTPWNSTIFGFADDGHYAHNAGQFAPTPANPYSVYKGLLVRGIQIDKSSQRSEGIKSNQDFTIIENSEVHHSLEFFDCNACVMRNNVLYEGNNGGNHIFVKGGIRNGQIYNNVVHITKANYHGIAIGGFSCDACFFDTSTKVEAYNTVAYNNVVINESGGAVTGLTFQGAHNVAFFNNVVIGGRLMMLKGGHNTGFQADTHNPTFRNNIISCNGDSAISTWLYTGTMTMDRNNFYNCSGVPAQTNAIVGNPLLVNPASDWHLKTGSPAINSGAVATMPAYGGGTVDVSRDKDSVTRTAPWDLGIYNVGVGGPPDTTPPTVSITAPASGSTVSGTSVTISANASDNLGVAGVQFKVDGANLGAEDTSSPYSISWNNTSATNGSHTLAAVARDAAGNIGTSAGVMVTVNNSVPSGSGPISLWKFDESSGTTASDASGTNTATLSGGASFTAGRLANALNLNGIDGQAKANTTTGLNLTQAITIAAWVKYEDLHAAGYRTVVMKGRPSARGFGLNIYNGYLNFVKVGVVNVPSTVAVPTGAFHHVTVTWHAATAQVKFYLNGVLAQTVSNTTAIVSSLDSDPLTIGSWLTGGSWFNGLLDDLRIYNRALSTTEVATLATPPAPDTTAPSAPTGLNAVASASQASLSWKASTDNIGVTGYRVYRNGTQVAAPASNSYIDGNLVLGTSSISFR